MRSQFEVVCMSLHNGFMVEVYKFYVVVYMCHCHVHSVAKTKAGYID